jgi:hypothetical protein
VALQVEELEAQLAAEAAAGREVAARLSAEQECGLQRQQAVEQLELAQSALEVPHSHSLCWCRAAAVCDAPALPAPPSRRPGRQRLSWREGKEGAVHTSGLGRGIQVDGAQVLYQQQ